MATAEQIADVVEEMLQEMLQGYIRRDDLEAELAKIGSVRKRKDYSQETVVVKDKPPASSRKRPLKDAKQCEFAHTKPCKARQLPDSRFCRKHGELMAYALKQETALELPPETQLLSDDI